MKSNESFPWFEQVSFQDLKVDHTCLAHRVFLKSICWVSFKARILTAVKVLETVEAEDFRHILAVFLSFCLHWYLQILVNDKLYVFTAGLWRPFQWDNNATFIILFVIKITVLYEVLSIFNLRQILHAWWMARLNIFVAFFLV